VNFLSRKTFLLLIIIFSFLIIGIFVLYYWSNADYLSKTKHETDSWAVVSDSKEDIIAVETVDPDIWISLKNLMENQTEMWIGGVVEEYDNFWGFRFKPDTIIIAEITIEGAQSNIRGISQDLEYWIEIWGKQAYVFAKVEEIHEIT
jgi:hypothetical protein